MNDKKIKEAMKQYIETQADNISSESEEKHDLTSLDEKVYAMLGTNQNKHKTAAVWSFRKISALAATFVLVISLSITAVFVLNKEPEHIAQDVFYSITISYENEQYGYFSNRLVHRYMGYGKSKKGILLRMLEMTSCDDVKMIV